jgi:cytochrome P450
MAPMSGSTDALAASAPAVAPPLQPGGRLGIAALVRFTRDPLRFITSMAQAEGDVVHYRLARRHVYLLKTPELVREVLVTRQHDFAKGEGLRWARRFLGDGLLTSEGELHTRQRRLAQPAFHRQRIASYGDAMVGRAAAARARWREGEPLALDQEMVRLTLSIAGKTLFDADTEALATEVGSALTAIMRLFPRFANPFGAVLNVLPLPSNRRYERGRRRLDEIVYALIEDRRRDGADRGDLLSMLMMARDEDGGPGMTDRQLRDEVMTLLLAGHETTANALCWTFDLLARNPEAEARLHRELDEALGGRLPAVDDLPRLAFTERVLAESMRLFPPAWALGRRALRELELGGARVAAGSLVLSSPYLLHRDPRLFPDPLRFDPDRFTPEAKAARPKFAYFPFGGGARSCIGEPFAWMEGVLVLATIAQQWTLRPVPGHPVEPQALITLRPRYGMRMVAARRQATH